MIRRLKELIEFSCKMKKEMKATQSGKKICREPTVKGRKWDSNQRFGTKGRNKHSTRTE